MLASAAREFHVIRKFVPTDLDASDLEQVVPLYQSLLDRPIGSASELERWLEDVSELSSVMEEYGARRYIDKSCHTDDPAIEARYMQFVEEVEPKTKPLFFRLQKKFLESPYREQLDGQRYAILSRKWQADVELFREANVPLETEVTKLVTEYDKVNGAMMVAFDGQTYTMQQMARFSEQTDRGLRERAWQAATDRRMQDREWIEWMFEQLLGLRNRIAANASFPDYRGYVWKQYHRFDYTPEECLRFADAIAETCVPLARKLDQERRQDLGLDALRPWDTAVDPKNRPPLEPFKQDQIPLFVERVKGIFDRMSPALGEDFDVLRRRKNLDLDSRQGKQPGGYQCSLEESREPFIFMNAAGLHRDVEVLLHEGGHAFHCLAARNEPLVFLRSAPMEFCEVASMSMELLGADHFDVFYPDGSDAARAKRNLMEGIIRFLPWMATIDSFQHWLYTNPGHSAEARTAFWLSLLDRFGGEVDWTGLEGARASSWQKQLHLFHIPFYYIEYGIAQLGALQVWMKSRRDLQQALSNYRAALALGGTRSLPELFAAAGIQFDLSPRTLLPLMHALQEELAGLPR
jgi:oligoendopeptidase F